VGCQDTGQVGANNATRGPILYKSSGSVPRLGFQDTGKGGLTFEG
jgi:hypothetical protein